MRGQPGGRREVEGGEENIVYNSKSADSGLLLYNNIHMLAGRTLRDGGLYNTHL